MKRAFLSLAGQPFEMTVPPADGKPAVFVLSVHKAGSTLIQNVVEEICGAGGRSLVQVEPDMFGHGIPPADAPLDALAVMEEQGRVFGGFRTPWLLRHIRQYRARKKLLFVRDPRDIAVSFYFSMAESHTIPDIGDEREAMIGRRAEARAIGVSDYVLAGHTDTTFENMREFAGHADAFRDMEEYRYEDLIYDKERLVALLAGKLHVALPADAIRDIAARHDIRPETERPDQHIRQVAPGNYKRHLSEKAQDYLTAKFEDVFQRYNYI